MQNVTNMKDILCKISQTSKIYNAKCHKYERYLMQNVTNKKYIIPNHTKEKLSCF